MIQMRTLLAAADNSGARSLMCIKVLGGTRRRYASVGDVIKVSVKDAIPRGKVRSTTPSSFAPVMACAARTVRSFVSTATPRCC